MPITRAQFDAILIADLGPMLIAVGKDGTTIDGTNPSLVGPARAALASLGFTPLSFTTIVDADFAGAADTHVEQLIEVGGLQIRRDCLDAYVDVDSQVDRDSLKLDQLAHRWERRIEQIEARLKSLYGIGLTGLTAGTINLGFAETGCSGEFD